MNSRRERVSRAYLDRRQRARASRSLDFAWRTVIFVVGGTLLGLGLFFLIFPGPGWATIWLGAVILASEFAWAQRLLVPLQRAAGALAKQAGPLRERRRALLIVTGATAAVIALYAWRYGLTTQGLFAMQSKVRHALGW